MKAKSSRPLVILLATIVAILTSMVVANATQTITTPNAVKIAYNLAAGGNSAPITPATNTSVLVMGCCTTSVSLYHNLGVAQVSLLHVTAIIKWFGFESEAPVTLSSGSTSMAGIHIVWIDSLHAVDIQTASGDTIHVHNAGNHTETGNVTLIW